MRSNRNIRLGIALIAGAFILILIWFVSSMRRSPEPVANDTTNNGITPVSLQTGNKTAIALEDIPERSIITPGMFRMEELPEGAAGADYVTTPATQAFGYITRRRIPRNSRLRLSDLVGHITDVGIAGALRPGTRAIVVPLPNKPTFHDLVRIGDTVDVISAFDGEESRTIVENVRVLAVDVFGKDYPTTSVAMRGDYKAPARSIGGTNLPSPQPAPAGTTTPAPVPDDGSPTPVPGAAPAPTPTPTPPPARPAPAITLEVTPDQANRISLAMNAGGALDFILVPRETPVTVPGTVALPVSVNKPQLAPYAASRKNAGRTTGTRTASTSTGGSGTGRTTRSGSGGGGGGSYSGPVMPPVESPGLPPAAPTTLPAVAPNTYDIPVYVDGKRIRTDTVRKPRDGS